MLDLLQKEFVSIVVHLTKKKEDISIKNNYLFVPKQIIVVLLEKNAYLLPNEKLRYWKRLYWIVTDCGRLTSRQYKNGEYLPMIKINISVAEAIKELTKM